MHKQFYSLTVFFISLLLSAGINAQTVTMAPYNATTGGNGYSAKPGDYMRYTITATNSTSSNLSNATVYGNIPYGSTYMPGTTKINGVSVADINGNMPFAASGGGLVNSSSSGAGILAPNSSAIVEYQVTTAANVGSLTNNASFQATNSLGTTFTANSNTISTSITTEPSNCNNVYQSTAQVPTGSPSTGYKFNRIQTVDPYNGTANLVYYSSPSRAYDALTGQPLYDYLLVDLEAMAYDASSGRIYYINRLTNNPPKDLMYVDLNRNPNAEFEYVDMPLETNTDPGYNIDRMTFTMNGIGYAITTNGQDLISFTVDPVTNYPTITPLGALINDPRNGTNDVLAQTGGDIFADVAGLLYLITNSYKMYRIDPVSRNTVYLGTISGIPAGAGVNSVAVAPTGSVLIGGNYQAVYKLDLPSMTAVAINSGTTNVWKNGDFASCAVPGLGAALQVTKSATDIFTGSTTLFTSGDPIEYTITISNTGVISAGGVMLADAIPANAHYIAGSTTMNGVALADIGGTMPFAAGNQNVNSASAEGGIIMPGDANKVVIKFRVTTDPQVQVCNQAIVSFSDVSGITTIYSDDPSKPGGPDATCFLSSGGLGGTRMAVNSPTSAKVQPNPFISDLSVQVKLNTAQQVQVRLIDFYGRTVYTTTQKLTAGYNSFHIDAPAGLAAGVYVLELSAGNNRLIQQKLIKQ